MSALLTLLFVVTGDLAPAPAPPPAPVAEHAKAVQAAAADAAKPAEGDEPAETAPTADSEKSAEVKKLEGKAEALPASVEALFEEKDDDGKPILGDEERKLLMKLPEHTRERIGKDVDDERILSPDHLKLLLSLKLSPQAADIVFTDGCVLCHSDPEMKANLRFTIGGGEASAQSHLDLKDILSDVHFRRGLMCSGCHGGTPDDTEMVNEISERWPDKDVRHTDRTWIPDFCGRCHADPAFMRNFNPSMPTDQLAKYRESKHGQLLLEQKDSNAAQCVACHGVHGIRGPKSRNSKVHPQAIPETCGACHADEKHMANYKTEDGKPLPTNQLAEYKKSVHGKALLEKGDLGAPACNDCHGNHAAMPPKVASVSQVCRTCHAQNGTFFDGSKHKKEFEKHKWPECEKCHGKHDIEKPTDDLISADTSGLCGNCHAEYSKDNPECNEGAKLFHSTLAQLVEKRGTFVADAEHLAERGLDVDPLLETVGELDEAITATRARVHTFDKGGFEIGSRAGYAAAAKADGLVEAAHKERQFRLNGLVLAIALMAFVAVILGFKIRELDKRREEEHRKK